MQFAPLYCIKHTQWCKRHLAPPLCFWLYQHTHFPFIQKNKNWGGRMNEPHEAPRMLGEGMTRRVAKLLIKHKIYIEKRRINFCSMEPPRWIVCSYESVFLVVVAVKMSIMLYWRKKNYQNPIQYSKRCAWCWISLDFPLAIPKIYSHNERTNKQQQNLYIYIHLYILLLLPIAPVENQIKK